MLPVSTTDMASTKFHKPINWFTQLVEHRATLREVVGSKPLPDQPKSAYLCNDICKWLDFLVLSDKDDKP